MSVEHTLTVETRDPLAEITIYDGAFKRVAGGVSWVSKPLQDALYEVRARVGGAVESRLVSLSEDTTILFEDVDFASPIPFLRGDGDVVRCEAIVRQACQAPAPLGAGGQLLLVVSDASNAPRSSRPIVGELGLVTPPGVLVFPELVPSGDAVEPLSATCLDLDPGVYTLRLALPDGGVRARTVAVSPGWRTECFFVERRGAEQTRIDLDAGAITMSRAGSAFHASQERLRLSETALNALIHRRRVAEAATQALMQSKLQDPVLGLLVAHLLLRDVPDHVMLPTVLSNVRGMLGADHPDVRALSLLQDVDSGPPSDMPMLRASWDRIVEASLKRPGLVPAGSPMAILAAGVLPSSPWLVWEPEDAVSRRAQSKLAALRSYVRPEPVMDIELDVFEPPAPATSAMLDETDREELARSLGVPGDVLDDMMTRIDD